MPSLKDLKVQIMESQLMIAAASYGKARTMCVADDLQEEALEKLQDAAEKYYLLLQTPDK